MHQMIYKLIYLAINHFAYPSRSRNEADYFKPDWS
jgi:hypothetical protein